MVPLKYVRQLGYGTFGDVHECEREDGSRVAVKRFFVGKKSTSNGIVNLKEMHCAVHIARGHPHLASASNVYMGACPFDRKLPVPKDAARIDKVYIETPLAIMDVYEMVIGDKQYPYSWYKRMMYHILSGLYHLHSHGIAHRDVKSNNVLFYKKNGKPIAKLTDFGMSRAIKSGDRNTIHVGNKVYNSPETIFTRHECSLKMDIWNTAITFVEMITKDGFLTGEEPDEERFMIMSKVVGPPSEEVLHRLTRGKIPYSAVKNVVPNGIRALFADVDVTRFEKPVSGGIPNPGTFDEFIDLLEHMLVFDPDRRYDAWECLQHPFFAKVVGDDSFVRQERIVAKSHVFSDPHWNVPSLDVFRRLKRFNDLNPDHVHRNSALFLGIDIYARISRSLHTNPSGKLEKYMRKQNPHAVAAVCAYIAYKYQFDELTGSYNTIFHFLQHDVDENKAKISIRVLEEMERKTIQLLNYTIARPIVYDFIGHDLTRIDVVFEYMLTNVGYYDFTFRELVDVITHHP